MIKLIDLIKENQDNPINRDIHYWLNNYNLLGIAAGFNQQYYTRMKSPFYGKLNLIIYDRKNLPLLEHFINFNIGLTGFLPKKPNNEFVDEDFFITPERVYKYSDLKNKISNPKIKNKAFLIQLEITKTINSKDSTTIVKQYY